MGQDPADKTIKCFQFDAVFDVAESYVDQIEEDVDEGEALDHLFIETCTTFVMYLSRLNVLACMDHHFERVKLLKERYDILLETDEQGD